MCLFLLRLLFLFPVLQLGKVSIKLGAANGGGGVIRVGHMCHQIIQQGSFGGIGELAIGIAPLTIILVKGTIRPFAQGGIIQRHAAALADQGAGAAFAKQREVAFWTLGNTA